MMPYSRRRNQKARRYEFLCAANPPTILLILSIGSEGVECCLRGNSVSLKLHRGLASRNQVGQDKFGVGLIDKAGGL